MTAAPTAPTAPTTAPAVTHPLDRLTSDEIVAARAILDTAGLLAPTTRFAYLGLDEPAKAEVLAFTAGTTPRRSIRAVLLDVATGVAETVVVSLTDAAVTRRTPIDPITDGQPPILLEEFVAVDEIVKADPGWVAAMAKRGLTDLTLLRPCPLSAGVFDLPGEQGRRLLRVLSFVANRDDDHCWAHPVDGVVAYVDLTARQVVELIDAADLPIPAEEGNFDDPAYTGPARQTLKPIEITQPAGPSYTVDGNVVSWEGWTFRVGFDAREGLILHQLAIQGRPVVYRASIAEMVVPYADPSPVRYWQNYFDTGEYLLGAQVNSLELGCDCLGEIHYFDADLADGNGAVDTRPNAICMHEEDAGVLWKHTDLFTESREVRRARRLVISFWATVGNYDYGFYWYLYLDGTIELKTQATGVMFTSSYTRDTPWTTQVAPGLGAPAHQHLFCARLDMTVDGVANTVDEVDIRPDPIGPDNPYGNAFSRTHTRINSEADSARDANPAAGRVWRIESTERANRLGQPTAYVLTPQGLPVLLADPSSSIARRAAFATKHLWVTRYDPAERFPAGDLVNQHPGHAGIPTYVRQDRPLAGQDVVLWHTFGLTHFPRTEDWPVMPTDSAGFTLKPYGFFDRNPTLDLPASTSTHCAPATGTEHTDAHTGNGACH
ncbi:primary-amine oxidase [Dactylosporangium cerinum]|uniref:Amine oxidase n=1 Tax=Dactylosporangium cerinum TaxID=1434730 RepID=A0ABV9WF72_9ACTN